MHDIQLVHIGEDYTCYSYRDKHGKKHEVEVTGIAQEIINTLGKSVYKESFLSKL